VGHVIFTIDAMAQLQRKPEVSSAVRDRILAVVDTALEARELPGGQLQRDARLLVVIDGYEVTYSLDLDRECATIIAVRPTAGRSADPEATR
jgi:hypothetical protein